jgi:hypothetical protein
LSNGSAKVGKKIIQTRGALKIFFEDRLKLYFSYN